MHERNPALMHWSVGKSFHTNKLPLEIKKYDGIDRFHGSAASTVAQDK